MQRFTNAIYCCFVRFIFILSLFSLGCGDTEETSPLLEENASIRFQNIGIIDGNLIPPDEIPYVEIELLRVEERPDEDNDDRAGENNWVWCRLVATPVPTHEDLVIMVGAPIRRILSNGNIQYPLYRPSRKILKTDGLGDIVPQLLVIPKNRKFSVEFAIDGGAFQWLAKFSGFHMPGINRLVWYMSEDDEYWVEVSEGEYKLLREVGFRVLGSNYWAYRNSNIAYYWSGYRTSVSIKPMYILMDYLKGNDQEDSKQHRDLPIKTEILPQVFPMLTSDRYAVPQGFQFLYYRVGSKSTVISDPIGDKPNQPPVIE